MREIPFFFPRSLMEIGTLKQLLESLCSVRDRINMDLHVKERIQESDYPQRRKA